MYIVKALPYLLVGVSFKWLVSKTPYLIHNYSKAPHITCSGVFLIVESLQWYTINDTMGYTVLSSQCEVPYLWSCPLDWDLPTMCNVIVIVEQVTRHAKVTDLKEVNKRVIHMFYIPL